MRNISKLDQCLTLIEQGLRTVYVPSATPARPNPADTATYTSLTETKRDLSARLMRVNHAGEVATQGLYQGHALVVKRKRVKRTMQRCAVEGNDHLLWCAKRLEELDGHPSRLNPLWYTSAMLLGALASSAGNKWGVALIHEAEAWAERQLTSQLQQVTKHDMQTAAILEQMKHDERRHGYATLQTGAGQPPWIVRRLIVPSAANLLTRTAYWI